MKTKDVIFYFLNLTAWISWTVLIWASLPSGAMYIHFNLYNEMWPEFIFFNLSLGFIIVYVSLEFIKYYREGKTSKEEQAKKTESDNP